MKIRDRVKPFVPYIEIAIALFLALILLSSVSANTYYVHEAHNQTFSLFGNYANLNAAVADQISLVSVYNGETVVSMEIMNITKFSSDQATNCDVFNNTINKDTLAIATFVSNTCALMYSLYPTQDYYVGANSPISWDVYYAANPGPVIDNGITWGQNWLFNYGTSQWDTFGPSTSMSIESMDILITTSTPLFPPQILSFGYTSTNETISLSWTVNTSINMTNISMLKNDSVIFASNDPSITSLMDVGLDPSTTYGYNLFITGNGGTTNQSLSAMTMPNVPTPPVTTASAINNVSYALFLIMCVAFAALFLVFALILKRPVLLVFQIIPFGIMGILGIQNYLTLGHDLLWGAIAAFGGVLCIMFAFLGIFLEITEILDKQKVAKEKKRTSNGFYE